MPELVEIQRADDPRDVIHRVVQILTEGSLVGLPTDTVYLVAAYALNVDAVQRLVGFQQAIGESAAVLAVKDAAEALDYFPGMSGLGKKLGRRCWPGPVILSFDAEMSDGLLGRLPEETRQILRQERVATRVIPHDVVGSVLRLMPAPLIMAGEMSSNGSVFRTAQELSAAAEGHVALLVDDGPARYGQPSSLVAVSGDDWHLLREGVVTHRTLNRLAGQVFLFICTGNTCRSPMAEGIFRKMLADRLRCAEEDLVDRGYVVASAGVAAAPGQPPAPEAVAILREKGVDLHGHESQPLTPRLLKQADHIFAMTRQHRDVIVHEFPEAADRVRLLSRGQTDISDPLGYGVEEYQQCAAEIEQHLTSLLTELTVS
jgi:protein-tyrosine phosphatase